MVFTMVGTRVFGVTAKRSRIVEADVATIAAVPRSYVAHDCATIANGPRIGRRPHTAPRATPALRHEVVPLGLDEERELVWALVPRND